MAEGQFRHSVGGRCRSENAVNCGSEQLSEGGTKGRVAIRLCLHHYERTEPPTNIGH